MQWVIHNHALDASLFWLDDCSMTSTLLTAQPTLDTLHARADAGDQAIIDRAMHAAVDRGASSATDVADLLVDAYIPIDATNGMLLHTLAAARRPGRIVEFGTSMGVSAIYLAAALRDGEPPVIATEIEPAKVERAREHLEQAGLADRVDIIEGDAFETLAGFDEPISLLFLDGWKDLYLPMLKLLEPHLVDGAIVVADDTLLLAEQMRTAGRPSARSHQWLRGCFDSAR